MNQNQIVTNNIILNNYINLGNSQHARNPQRLNIPNKEASIEDIMRYFGRYKNILPHSLNVDFDFKTMLFPFEKAHIVELLNQMDILVQLLIQVKIEILR
jgi:hypothetical protein